MKKSIFEKLISKRFKTKYGDIAYWINDNCSQKYTLVFLHGLTADHTLFEKQIAYFYKDFKVLCWDAPAH